MSLSIGIIGLPNVGKSTLFNALLQRQAALAANYPFATIEPNVGIVDVNDDRLIRLVEYVRNDYGTKKGDREVPEKIVPAVVKFYDIAGLVKGASKGEGLGNAFLGHIRGVDAVLHLVRVFEDPNIIQTGTLNPESDIETINTELILADLEMLEKKMSKIESEAKRGQNKDITHLYSIYNKIKGYLDEGSVNYAPNLTEDEKNLLFDLPLLTMKPMMYVYNAGEEVDFKELDNKVYSQKYSGININSKIESELSSFDIEEKRQMMQEMGIIRTGLDKVIFQGYSMLGLQSFFTMGPKEVHAWTVRKGSKAPNAAGTIHTDFERGFISAEVVNIKDMDICKSLKTAKDRGLVRLEGKEYLMQDGDIVEFRFNV